MNIRQFRYSSDNNLGYVIYGKQSAIAIDGGAVEAILSFLKTSGLTLSWVVNTHGHYDHTSGNQDLIRQTGAAYLDNQRLQEQPAIHLEGETIRVYRTPGHTEDSLTFLMDGAVLTGDTLFNGTVGNCFTGDLLSFYRSIKQLMSLPSQTLIYAGHDYVDYSMKFARMLEPDNREIDRYLKQYNPNHVCSTMEDELKVNPYLRFNDPSIIAIMHARGLPTASEYERWESVMKLE